MNEIKKRAQDMKEELTKIWKISKKTNQTEI
jgi:hypothetical protein